MFIVIIMANVHWGNIIKPPRPRTVAAEAKGRNNEGPIKRRISAVNFWVPHLPQGDEVGAFGNTVASVA